MSGPRKRRKDVKQESSKDEGSFRVIEEEEPISTDLPDPKAQDEYGHQKKQEPTKKRSCFCLKCLLVVIVVAIPLVAIFGVIVPAPLTEYQIYRGSASVKDEGLGSDVLHLFSAFDANKDGLLDGPEFCFAWSNKHIDASKFAGQHYDLFNFIDPFFGKEGEEVIQLTVDFEPLVLSTMSKFSSFTHQDGKVLVPGLTSWQAPYMPLARYAVKNFAAFAPPPEKDLGRPYHIFGLGSPSEDVEMAVDMLMSDTTPYRHVPPQPSTKEDFLFALMHQFHQYPFLETRFGPRGSVAIVRAENNEYWDIFIRAHVEFQLNHFPALPFWFTPGQFSGRLIMSKDSSHVVKFELEVPNNRSLNVDMEWLTTAAGDGNEVDIGYLPMMRLSSVGSSRLLDAPLRDTEAEPRWTEEIDPQTARERLDRLLYPFKAVKYHDFKTAFDLAAEQNKPVHHILLWGALDDQSC